MNIYEISTGPFDNKPVAVVARDYDGAEKAFKSACGCEDEGMEIHCIKLLGPVWATQGGD